MKQHLLLASLTATATAWQHPNDIPLQKRQSASGDDASSADPSPTDRPYQDYVCRPPYDPAQDDIIPPCVSAETTEFLCAPNGTEPIHLDAHAQCMCNGSFFADKLACDRCHFVHGFRSERQLAYYSDVLDRVSSTMCAPGSTPSAEFADIFSSMEGSVSSPTTGETALNSDEAVSETGVGAYYTASGEDRNQGPGAITGDATGATASATPTTTPASGGDDDDGEESASGTGDATTSAEGTGATGAAAEESDDNSALPRGISEGAAWGIACAVAVVLAAI